MDILIRNLEETTVKVLDKRAKKAGLSRQEYLLMQLNRMADVEAFAEMRKEYSTLVKNMGQIVSQNTEQLKDLQNEIENMRFLLDEKEVK